MKSKMPSEMLAGRLGSVFGGPEVPMNFSPSDVAGYYAARVPNLRQRGRRWRGLCPIHKGKHENFSVDPETGLWRCWSDCGRGGDIIALEIALTGVAWRNAVTEIEQIIGRPLLDRPASQAQRRALAERGAREQPARMNLAPGKE